MWPNRNSRWEQKRTESYVIISILCTVVICVALSLVLCFFLSLLVIWGRYNLKCSRRTVIFLPVYKISSLKITLPKTLQLKTLDFLQQTITMYFFFLLIASITLFATCVLFILEVVLRLGFNEVAQFLSKSEVLVAISLFKSVFFSPIIILFLQYSHKRSSHVPEIWPIQDLMFNILFQTR